MKRSYATRIRARIAEIEASLAQIEPLRAELDELRVAAKVLEGLAVDDGEDDDASEAKRPARTPKPQKAKPPTVRDRAILALRVSPETWLTGEEIVDHIIETSGVKIGITTIRPTLTKLKDEGLILREGTKVALAERLKEPSPPASAKGLV
jgi:hypothetical protein